MRYSRIIGTGSYLPSQILTNDDLSKMVNTSDEWITTRTGIKERHLTAKGESAATMAKIAAEQALRSAKIDKHKLGMVIVATCTPQTFFPSVASAIQHELGLSELNIPAFDLNAVCSGFLYALSVADQYIRSQAADYILVVGADSLTKLVDWTDRSTCVLFGDGAGAVILKADNYPGIYSTHLYANGSYGDLLMVAGDIYDNHSFKKIKMQGNAVFKVAVTKLEEAAIAALKHNRFSKDEINWLIPHQANLRIIEATAKKLGISMEQVILTIAEQGNTSAASIPLALDVGVRDGRIKAGDLILMEAFGAGFSWGSALVRY